MDDRDPQTFAIIGAAMEVHRRLNSGFLEALYRQATAIEFAERGIAFAAEADLVVRYRDRVIGCFRADFLCHDDVVVEVKARSAFGPLDVAQTLNYLRAAGASRALLLNFGASSLEYKRFVRSARTGAGRVAASGQ
jgi:GxxExxY protein